MIAANSIIGGRYRVTKPLGGGGMKLVYLAEDLRLASRPCALAEMVDSFTDPGMQQQAIAAFQREADMLAQLSNEHIPRVFDRFSEQNRHYLVMEYVDGYTLEDELKKRGDKLPENEVIDIAIQVLDTLGYLHNLEPPVVYRDLKPSNVMIGRNGQVKLIDFGIARFFLPQSNATMIGTQGYAPPEQYRGRAEARSDLYALGATMHHALSGRDPAAEAPFSFPKIRTLCPTITPALADLVDQALEYDVIHRMADAREFKERLLAIKSGAATARVNGPATSPRPAGKPQMRLPLGGSAPRPTSAPADATVILRADDMHSDALCPSCRRSIPSDSRYCSFCGMDVTASMAGNGVADSPTTVLPEHTGGFRPHETAPRPDHFPHWRSSGRDPRPIRFIVTMVVALFIVAIAVSSVVNYLQQAAHQRIEPSAPSEPIPPEAYAPHDDENPSPDTAEPEHTSAMAITLRQWLNMQGYGAVHFSLKGDEVILWGTVPNEFERRWVRTQATMLTGATSVIDHIVIRPNPEAESEP